MLNRPFLLFFVARLANRVFLSTAKKSNKDDSTGLFVPVFLLNGICILIGRSYECFMQKTFNLQHFCMSEFFL